MSRFLLDTHVWLWLQADPDRIPVEVLDRLADESNEIVLSAASSWEIAFKHALGKLVLPEPPDRYVPDRMRRSGTSALAVEHGHALAVSFLPPIHRDPFDRLLVAQSRALGLTLVTADAVLSAYDVPIELIAS